jgi:hypothetical protein
VAFVFIGAGFVGLAYHATEWLADGIRRTELWALVLRALAVVCGVFLLRGQGWARWLAIAWLAYHVALSTVHSVSETVMHTVLLAVIAYVLFRADASGYFSTDGKAG